MIQSRADLLRRARSGDTGAFEALLDECFDAAYAVALGVTGTPQDAEDVCQDAFVRAWRRLEQCRDGERFRGWLMAVVRSVALNHRVTVSRRRGVPLDDTLSSATGRPDADAARAELRRGLEEAVRHLGRAQREVLLLYDLEGWRHAEIAGLLGISEAMSRRHLSDARARMRALLWTYAGIDGGVER